MNVLGIETSCDETAAAVVRDGRDVLSNVVFSQVALHRPYGGVVPEIASRSHLEQLPSVIAQALADAGLGWDDIDRIAVTYGPGLATALLVGLSSAKALAMRLDRPLVGIHHMEAHVYSIFMGPDAPAVEDICPFVALAVSGGHTCLLRVRAFDSWEVLGQTMDDAAGEAFDKGANLLGLGYPGGPAIEKAARTGNPRAVMFPQSRHKRHQTCDGLDPRLCFSFSGLKTALLYHLRDHPAATPDKVADVAASYQEAIVDTLVDRAFRALQTERTLAVVGGVSLNSRLREKCIRRAEAEGVRALFAPRPYCADNAAMVAGLAGRGFGISGPAALDLDVQPSAPMGG